MLLNDYTVNSSVTCYNVLLEHLQRYHFVNILLCKYYNAIVYMYMYDHVQLLFVYKCMSHYCNIHRIVSIVSTIHNVYVSGIMLTNSMMGYHLSLKS